MRFSDLAGRKVVVWGHGLEGRAAAEHCRVLGIPYAVAVPDAEAVDPAHPELLPGARGVAALRAADVVIKSPGVPVTSPLYVELASAGVAFTSVLDLWLTDNAARAVGVTGTKGKSTTASAIGHLLSAVGEPSSVRGNIGRSLLEESGADETVVVEISSYQAQALTVSPRIAVVTSLFPEHLPWHGSAERYFADKLKMVEHRPEHVVAPGLDARLVGMVRERLGPDTQLHLTGPGSVHADAQGDVVWPGVGRVRADELPVRGLHNAGNLALALLAARLVVDGRAGELLDAARTFAPLRHRLEVIPSRDGRTWVDDNLATAPEAVVAALQAWPDDEVALIFGGADRGLDLGPVADYLRGRSAPVTMLLIGPAGARFGEEHGADLGVHRCHPCRTLEDAVAWALSSQNGAQVVLMSPGAPSFDEYADYAARAEHLRALVAG